MFSETVIREKLDAVSFRGPDHSGFEIVEDKVILGHNRLSIIDLDERSHQPFFYEHLVIVFNGEIYNFNDLKIELSRDSFIFRTTCDTEVICAAYLKYGTDCVRYLNGMFAFVIFDKKKNSLFGARDRMGQKPFYYCYDGNTLEFASQPKQLKIQNDFSISEIARDQFFRWGYIPEPNCIYNEVAKLKAGHSFVFELDSKKLTIQEYWNIPQNQHALFKGSFKDAVHELDLLLNDAVKIRMVADVPLGVFLSGGIDSSLIAAIAQSNARNSINTFSVAFSEADFDESKYAEEVANALGTNHHTIPCDYKEGIDLIYNLCDFFDEPFADASAIPTMLLAKHTRKFVTVALSGDAGDESFIGYNRYDMVRRLEPFYKFPNGVRKLFSTLFNLSPKRSHREVVAQYYTQNSLADIYYKDISSLDKQWMLDPDRGENKLYKNLLAGEKNIMEKISDFDLKTYLCDDINTKVDRATMAFSLEARAPLEDFRIIEFARNLPTDFKYKDQRKKIILKALLNNYLPAHLFDRPKTGFGMPMEHWFRNDLKAYLCDLVSAENLRQIPNINVEKCLAIRNLHLDEKENQVTLLWKLMVYIAWMKKNP